MGSIFRSEHMLGCQLIIQPEAAYSTISKLGELGCVQFKDLNQELSQTQRQYVSEIRRCDEMERKLRYIQSQLIKEGMMLRDVSDEDIPLAPAPREVIYLEADLEKIEMEIKEISLNFMDIANNYAELLEYYNMLKLMEQFLADHMHEVSNTTSTEVLIRDNEKSEEVSLDYIVGVVPREKFSFFEKMLWRVSRGNVFLKRSDLEIPIKEKYSDQEIKKIAFIAFYQGKQLGNKIEKICTGFQATIFNCPPTEEGRLEKLKILQAQLEDMKTVINQSKDRRDRTLNAAASDWILYSMKVMKMKAIYFTLNMMSVDVSKRCLVAEGWVPENDWDKIREVLMDCSKESGSTVPPLLNIIQSPDTPPTYFRTNKFTKGFQNLIDAYGLATYGEVNPALYTIITFPFLFAVMFGDLGHGIILTLFGLWMVLYETKLIAKKIKDEIWKLFFGGRYIILLMGLFSMYTGVIYNDVFSRPLNLFGSSWQIVYNTSTVMENEQLTLDPAESLTDNVYAMGIDPGWLLGVNKIIFLNTFKMKLSIIIAVVHMIFGVSLSMVNIIRAKRFTDIWLEFLPRMIFLVLVMGYLALLIILKWFLYSGSSHDIQRTPRCAPSVLITFINMMLMTENKKKDIDDPCDPYMFTGQKELQYVLLSIALICIPWMLLAKPFYIMYHRRLQAQQNDVDNDNSHVAHVGHDNEPLSEIFIYQAIHTVEYALNTVSHTASYLRLWALSLAHSQLSEVVWNRILKFGLILPGYTGAGILIFVFSAWCQLTVGILVIIEGLSAFLHTLRLHWVEFMSKFYEGMGEPFVPFSLKKIINDVEG